MSSHWRVINSVANYPVTPEELWNSAMSYFKWCDDNKITSKKTVLSGRMPSVIEDEYHRPYTVKGFCMHANITEDYISDIKSTKREDSLWYQVMMKILYVIHTQNVEMATIGLFNAVFTSKILALDKADEGVNRMIKVEIVSDLPALSESENEAMEKLELETVKRNDEHEDS